MRVVIDSSVLVAASISRAGVCAKLLEDVLIHHELVVSEWIFDELVRKLTEKFRFPHSEAKQLRRFLEKASLMVEPADIPPNVCRDAADLPIIGTAVAGAARMLITVDKDLLIIGEYKGIPIIKPGTFWHRTVG